MIDNQLIQNHILTDKISEIIKDKEPETLISAIKCLATAVNNLNRVINFKDLYIRLLSNEITYDEYDAEIDNNENQYVLESNGHMLVNPETISTICDVSDMLGYNFVDDLTGLFGLSKENFAEILRQNEES